jgi:squalene cyclase
MEDGSDKSRAENFGAPLLVGAQNSDGGWGFHPSAGSRVEPTCWVLKALTALESRNGLRGQAVNRGLAFLMAAQLPDGSWPSTPEMKTGCWVTSLACWVLRDAHSEKYQTAIGNGLRWICRDWPKDSSPWRKRLRKFSPKNQHFFKFADGARGWGWTPRTSSWVEPTALALLALEGQQDSVLPSSAQKRRKLGEALLYDRMCVGGGWNCGNPWVYGVPGDPLVVPTSWALLALRAYPEQRESLDSLAWLERSFGDIKAPGSLALATICLESYGRERPGNASLSQYDVENESTRNTQVAAWRALAVSDTRRWLSARAGAEVHD